jgi:SMODS and SLOG-associating 2TM effector domain family 4
MFALSLIDTLRLAFGQVVYYHKAHTKAATSLARWSRWSRTAETMLLVGVVISALGSAFGRGQHYATTAAVLASLALVIFLIHVTFDFEANARAHHVCSTRLWHIREQYRALLTDLTDNAIDPAVARARRDALMAEVTNVYESSPPITGHVFKTQRRAVDGAEEQAMSDREIDRFLPKSLHGSAEPATATSSNS